MLTLTGREIRKKFIDYFVSKGHTHRPSSSLIPYNDPTLLFNNAGMNQFKDVFLGLEQCGYSRAVTAQKCVRAGGKHNDLDTVGRTARHHTFFEMMGNFSFGDYFKRDAILFAWEFLTVELGLPAEKLYVSVYEDDDEAYDLWQELTPVPAERIVRLGEKENFWSMGDTGPCGPCSEIHFDRGEQNRCNAPECALGVCDCDRWLEIWNLVFMQFDRDAEGNMTPLPKPSIDTGMGLERVASIIQDVSSNYETDLIFPLIKMVEELSGRKYDRGESGFPFRVIADHARSCSFLIADGVLPSNEGRGYVLRRILRRAVRFGKVLGIEGPFLYRFTPVVIDIMGDIYPELEEKLGYVQKVIRTEEERFQATLNEGIRKANDMIAKTKEENRTEISGEDVFSLYDTYGFPIDLTGDLAEENGLTVDEAGFEQAMETQRERARNARSDSHAWDLAFLVNENFSGTEATVFTGYESLSGDAEIKGILFDGAAVKDISGEGREVYVLLDRTPFYPEGGGQQGDSGVIAGPAGEIRVNGTLKMPDGKIIHKGILNGEMSLGPVSVSVDERTRKAAARNHTATHLLHKALKEVLGDHVNQSGSFVSASRLRFDFTHFSAPTAEEIRIVTEKVNEAVLAAMEVETFTADIDKARSMGATALFGEKYGDVVRCVRVEDFSLELCGGTHVKNTAEIGSFRILSEGAVAAGVRRIEAVTGSAAYREAMKEEALLKKAGALLKSSEAEVPERISLMQENVKNLEKEIEKLKLEKTRDAASDVISGMKEINGFNVVIAGLGTADSVQLRNAMDTIREKAESAVILLGAVSEGKVIFVSSVSKDLVKKGLHAGNIVREAAKAAGGGGGGRPDMAQAGGRNPEKLAEALKAAEDYLAGLTVQ